MLLLSVSIKTMSQNDYVQVTLSEIKRANITKARLDSSLAAGQLLLVKVKNYQDSLQIYQDSTKFWKHVGNLQTRRKKGWRKAALISGGIVVAQNSKEIIQLIKKLFGINDQP